MSIIFLGECLRKIIDYIEKVLAIDCRCFLCINLLSYKNYINNLDMCFMFDNQISEMAFWKISFM
jgi:hypothetical protein